MEYEKRDKRLDPISYQHRLDEMIRSCKEWCNTILEAFPAISDEGGDVVYKAPSTTHLIDPSAPMVPPPYISLGNQLGGVEFSKNTMPANIDIDPETRAIVSGFGSVPTTIRGSIANSLRINSLYEPEGTKIVRVNISRGTSPIDIWGDKSDARDKEGDHAALVLVDDTGQQYIPRGFLHRRDGARQLDIELDAINGIDTITDFPALSTAGKDKLEVIYLVPEGRKIIGIKLGDTTVARFDFTAKR